MKMTMISAVCALLACSAASAQTTHQNVRTIEVKYSDLNLSTELGQDRFKQRVMRAVRNVCAYPEAKTAADRADEQQCRARAKTNAMRKAGQTIARYGGSVKVALD